MRLRSTANRSSAAGGAHGLFTEAEAQGRPVGEILVANGLLRREEMTEILRYQKQRGVTFEAAAVTLGKVDADVLESAIAGETRFALLSPGNNKVDPLVRAAFSTSDREVVLARAVRTKITSSIDREDEAEGPTMIAVVGIGSVDETAILAANLAVISAQLGSNTLLIDAGLDAPTLDRLFRLPNNVGMTSHLEARQGIFAAQQTALARLWVMPTGPSSPGSSTYLQKQSLATVIRQWSLPATQIIVALPGVDIPSMSVGSMLKGFGSVVIVTRKGDTTIADVRLVIDDLDAKSVPVAGSVIS